MPNREKRKQELYNGLGQLVDRLNSSKGFIDGASGGKYYLTKSQFDISEEKIVVSYDTALLRNQLKGHPGNKKVVLAEIVLFPDRLESIATSRYSLTAIKASKTVEDFLHTFAHEHGLKHNGRHTD